MSNNIVPGVYKWVMDDVIEKMTRRFAELGMDENVLHELQQLWEQKIIQMNVAPFVQLAPNPTESIPPPSFSSEAEGLGYAASYSLGGPPESDIGYTYQSPSALTALASQNQTGQHVEYRLQQHDGASDESPDGQIIPSREELDKVLLQACVPESKSKENTSQKRDTKSRIAQLDGDDDEDDEDDQDDGDNSDIGSELDDEESEDGDVEVDRMILCQYEKVSRIRNKWRCVLKDGIATINGKDYLFNKANGEFEW